ncbi:hypothetical protein GQ43DRAFT_365153, partial [Delitschia confertaspora ATCC 74209]
SWIEIDSRQSSSSLSSAGEEIVTTGLRVQHDSNTHRRRRRRGASQFQLGYTHRAASAGGTSSQEEYEESDSEPDRVMTSSNEGIGRSPLQCEIQQPSRTAYSVASSETMSEHEEYDDDDDENATAVNYPRSSNRTFEPRPNAFSHPPGSYTGQSYPQRRPGPRPSSQRHSYPQHSPFNAYQADHDEALRASLSTLLSAAAAVRRLPKPGQPSAPPSNGISTRIDPSTLRLVPESVALGGPQQTPTGPRSTSEAGGKSKRKAVPPTNGRSSSKDRQMSKRARKTGPLLEEVSPTLFTWMVSAGVVVLVSALSFSAGYMVGREAGHAEAVGQLGSVGADAGRCGKEAASGIGRAGMGLRRLRWSATSGVRV